MRKSAIFAAVVMLALSALPLSATNTGSVDGTAALEGSYGYHISLDGSDSPLNIYVRDDSPSDETTYRATFKLKAPSASALHFGTPGTPSNKVGFFKVRDLDGDGRATFLVVGLRYTGSALIAYVKMIDEDHPNGYYRASNGQAFETNVPYDTLISLTIEYQRASSSSANDGIVKLYKNGVLKRENNGLNYYRSEVDQAIWGMISIRSGSSATGDLYLDSFESYRTLSP